MRKIVLTGAGGFLGSHLLVELIGRGVKVCAVSSKSPAQLLSAWGGVESVDQSSVKVINRDDWNSIASEIENADVLVNCAFPRNADGCQLADGMDYLQRLFAIAGSSQVGAVVNISSQSVYSQTRTEPAREDTPVCLESKYAVAKYASEQLLEAYCGDKPHTSIRLASLMGPGFDQRVVNKMVKRVVEGEGLVVKETGARYGFLDVRDAARAITEMVRAPLTGFESSYNVGVEHGYTVTEIATHVVTRVGAFVENASIEKQRFERNEFTTAINSGRFRQKYGWKPEFTLDMTIDSILGDEAR